MTEFISRNYGNECYEIIIKTDSHDHYRATEEFARRLIDHSKPMRNADKIRAMSDEELAKSFAGADWCAYCDQLKEDGSCHGMELGGPLIQYCIAGCLKWLRTPAEEGER